MTNVSGGSASAVPPIERLLVTAAYPTPRNATTTINIVNDKAQFTVTGLEKKDDKYSITFVIQNDSAFDAKVSVKTNTNTNTANFAFTNSLASDTITAGGSVEVTVTVELITELTAAASGSFVIELDVTAGE